MLTNSIILLLSILAILGQAFILFSIIYFILGKKIDFIEKVFTKNSILFVFIISFLSMIGSLFLSEFAGMQPCELCWIQRIFMYPIAIITGVTLWKKDLNAKVYILSLALPGILFAGYHYYIQMFNAPSFCTVTSGISCAISHFTKFGYINIPMMSLTAFAMIITLFVVYKK